MTTTPKPPETTAPHFQAITFKASTDRDGKDIVLIDWPYEPVKMFPSDFVGLSSLGADVYWSAYQGPEMATPNILAFSRRLDRFINVTFHCATATLGHRIRFKDGNPFNLRRDNLIVA